ncbi:interferon regulatory factor 5-like isoform X3 [Leopardus geoffroyi]|uniref:interferon regulatory factor 5-like isoform X3 n=1 Tax=Leopardus geoffroyi TaxID=46844 RepID=UPI001E25FC75|nr:interferon regulatory factor 5-like isoform X3 [Leopardus geoffroyi]
MAGDPWRKEEGKVPDGRRPMAGAGGPQRLRDWLVAQIESGRYAGLRWEDAGKTLFRIPWKHAAQQGYQAQQDAALFRAWAIHKGRHLEGIDKEDPPTWKTRLRCALNKSADFCEVRERSQLDISDPYKVYRIVSGSAHGPVARTCAPPGKKNILRSRQEPPGDVMELLAHRTDQASCPASPCSLASSVTSALGALWHCRLSCPLLQLLPRHHPCLSCQLDLFLPLLYLYYHPRPRRPLPFASNVCGSTAGCIRPVSSKLTPRPCHPSRLCPHLCHLCPHLCHLCPLTSATSVPMSVTSVSMSITSVPISITSVPTLSCLSPPLSPLSPHPCYLCPHVYHLCPHLYHFCPHL